MKTSELRGSALDWAVAKCEGFDYSNHQNLARITTSAHSWEPSLIWSQGGPIIEREGISAMQTDADSGDWEASIWLNPDKHMPLIQEGPTPLIAAMRAYVASKMGEEVDVPAELED